MLHYCEMADTSKGKLKKYVASLQLAFAEIDFWNGPSRGGVVGPELLVFKRESMKFKMYSEKGHKLPHIHIDYGSEHHVASYSIDPARRLSGRLSAKHDRAVVEWVTSNREDLCALWSALQAGEDVQSLLVELSGDW